MRELFDYLDGVADEQIRLLRRLVSIDSGTDDKSGVDAVGHILADELRRIDLTADVVPEAVVGDHVSATKPGQDPSQVLLLGHLDTVFPTGTAADRPFRIEGDRAFGPGVYDMRGGLTVLLFALRAIREARPKTWDRLTVKVILNSDEEPGSDTSRSLISAAAQRAAIACILEPARAGGEYVCARKGVSRYVVKVRGIAAHSGNQPHLGASAISELARKIAALDQLNGAEEGLTVNVGVIRGGTRVNMVPDFAECEVEMRLPTEASLRHVETAVAELSRPLFISRTTTEILGGVKQYPMEPRGDQDSLWALLARAADDAGFEMRKIATGAASDGNTTSRYVATLDGMGPVGDFAHSPNEFILVPSLLQRTKALARFLDLWVGSSTHSQPQA